MRTSPKCTYDPLDIIPFAYCYTNYWLINANTNISSPSITTNLSVLMPNIVTDNLATNAPKEATVKYLTITIALVIMDPYKPEALMRFTAPVSLNGLLAMAVALIGTTTPLYFVNTGFIMANGLYKDCKTAPKMATVNSSWRAAYLYD